MRVLSQLEIECQITGYGSMSITFTVDGAGITIGASYMSDVLSDLVRAIGVVLNGEACIGSAFFTREPQAAALTVVDRGQGVELWIDDSEIQTGPRLLGVVTAQELRAALVNCLNSIDRAQYREEWPDFELPQF